MSRSASSPLPERAASRSAPGSGSAATPRACPGRSATPSCDEDRALRAELIDTIEDNFYKPVNEQKLDDASLKGIVESLDDRFSHYLTPKEAHAVHRSASAASSRASA